MKNQLVINLDTENEKAPITIGKFEEAPKGEIAEVVLLDMATICEALVAIINSADQMGIKNKMESLDDCIMHIKAGVN